MRGVDVRVMLPAHPDHLHVWLAPFSYLEQMEAAGVKMCRYQDGFLHEKVALVDEDVAVVGTANLDNRSARLNFEINIVVSDRFLDLGVAGVTGDAESLVVVFEGNGHGWWKAGSAGSSASPKTQLRLQAPDFILEIQHHSRSGQVPAAERAQCLHAAQSTDRLFIEIERAGSRVDHRRDHAVFAAEEYGMPRHFKQPRGEVDRIKNVRVELEDLQRCGNGQHS